MHISWPKWFNENKRFCPSRTLVIWIKRATGVGYMEFPPLSKEPIADLDAVARFKAKSDAVVREVERLEKELRRLGIRQFPFQRG